MAKTVLITLTLAGSDTGPFDLYSDVDGYAAPFENNVPKASLTSGYTSILVPDLATTIRVMSDGLCTNYIDLIISTTTSTSTSTTSTSSTSTTSTSTSSTTTVNLLAITARDLGALLTVDLFYAINAGSPVLLGTITSGTCSYMGDIIGILPGDTVTFTSSTSCVMEGASGYLVCPAISGAAIDYVYSVISPGIITASITINSSIIP